MHGFHAMMNHFMIVFQHYQRVFWFGSVHIWWRCSRKLATFCKNSLSIQTLKSLSIKDKPICNLQSSATSSWWLHTLHSTLLIAEMFTVKTPNHCHHGIRAQIETKHTRLAKENTVLMQWLEDIIQKLNTFIFYAKAHGRFDCQSGAADAHHKCPSSWPIWYLHIIIAGTVGRKTTTDN